MFDVIPQDIINMDKGLKYWSILTAYRGSIAHGMYVPNSNPNSIDDIDIISICVPNDDYYFGLKEYGSRNTVEIKEREWDIVIYEVRKAVKMLMNCNPNIMSLLWLNPKHYLHKTSAGQLLLDNRELFSTKQIYHAFMGYANDQLKKMTHLAFKGYMGDKRKRLVEKFGFDTKNAAHLIRLLRMGIEFLNEGKLYVERHDYQELLEIKAGEWSLHEVVEESDRLFAKAKEAFARTLLPESADFDKVNDLLVHMIGQTNYPE